MATRPIIGILLDYEASGSFSKRPHYALRQAYFDAVWRARGMPLGLSYLADAIPAALETVHGVLMPGGTYPFPERFYGNDGDGGEDLHPRYVAERSLLSGAFKMNMPVLGICAGMQLIAGEAGVRLFKDLKNEVNCAVDHLNEKPAEETAHSITITPGTKLRVILGKDEMMVNTAHNEAPRPCLSGDAAIDAAASAVPWPEHLIVSAVAPDGVIEGIERTDHPYCIGVQWHPEFFAEDGENPNARLFETFVEAAHKFDRAA